VRVVWDLDGVVRDLNGYIVQIYGGKYPDKWDYVYATGKNIYDTINENLDILTNSPPTAYCTVLKKHYSNPEIWTSQPKKWQEATMSWICKHIGEGCTVKFYKTADKERELEQNEDLVLVEDSPNFKNYDRIILIDRPYNQKVKSVFRIYGTKHLNNMLERMKEL